MRFIFGIDAANVSSRYSSALMKAIAFDSHNKLFLITFSMMEIKCKNSWEWFIYHLRIYIIECKNKIGWLSVTEI